MAEAEVLEEPAAQRVSLALEAAGILLEAPLQLAQPKLAENRWVELQEQQQVQFQRLVEVLLVQLLARLVAALYTEAEGEEQRLEPT